MKTISEWWMWIGFFCFIAIMLLVDIFLLGGRKARRITMTESLAWVIVWATLAMTFNVLLWWYLNLTATHAIANQKALEFLTGYLIEESLSVDNMFIFLMIFNYFKVPAEYQRRVLLLGVIGAIFMRLLMILFGVWLVSTFHWILFVFGAFLILTGFKMFWVAGNELDLATNPILRWMNRHFNVKHTFEKEQFFTIEKGKLFVTPLFLVLILIELSDLIFAIDSIPAIFAITSDPFIIFTSNIFAILGLRALYFFLANMAARFHLLKYGLAVILIFIGIKMLIADWYKIPISVALSTVAAVLFICILLSLMSRKPEPKSNN